MENHLPDPNAPLRGLPELFDLGVKARSLAYLFVAGAAVGTLTLALPHAAEVDDRAVVLLVIGATAVGAVLYLYAERLREWQLHLAVGGGHGDGLARQPGGGDDAALSRCSTRGPRSSPSTSSGCAAALAQLAFIGVNYAVVLVIQDGPALRWMLAVGTPAVTGLLMARLLAGIRREAAARGGAHA